MRATIDHGFAEPFRPAPDARRWWTSAIPVALLGAAWAASYLGGGSHTPLLDLFYVPIVVAGVTLGLRGGALAGLVAALLAGPLLPLDVATGEAQSPSNWSARGAFFVAIGAFAGAGVDTIRRTYEAAIERSLHAELARSPYRSAGTVSQVTTAQLQRLLDTRAFHVVFQPIQRLDDDGVIALEALTRFHADPYRPPNVWFELAAAAGLGTELELAAMESALDTAQEAMQADVALSVNLSPSVLLDPRLLALLERYPDRQLVLEVTEHAIIDDYQQLDDSLGELRRRGARLAVDDAGAGFSSLRHIVRLAPEVIKLDLSLTQGLGKDPVRAALADCLVEFAHRTGAVLVVEGLEHPADLQLWRELGADAAQGYLIGRPAPLPVTVDASG